MTLDSGLSIGASGLANVNRQLALLSHNIGNASTPGYVRQVSVQTTLTADGLGMGVRSGPAMRDVDLALRDDLWSQAGLAMELRTRHAALVAIDAVHGAPGAGQDLPSLLGKLRDTFSSLATDPSDQVGQRAVVIAAETLTQSFHALASAYATQRQSAQDNARADIATLNAKLAEVGATSDRIIKLKSMGESTADLETQRDAAVGGIAELIGVKPLAQANGDMLLVTPQGMMLPTRGAPEPFSLADAAVQAGAWYPGGGLNGILLGGTDVTAQFFSGRIGANIALRDAVLPQRQAGLDEVAWTLSRRLDDQGLRLLTDPAGNIAAGGGAPVQAGYVGYASVIQVNATIAADPAFIRDGTHAVAGSPTGASAFVPNPSGGPAGFNLLIQRVLDFGFGPDVQAGVAHAPVNTTNLGPGGGIAQSFGTATTIIAFAEILIASDAGESSATALRSDAEQAVRDVLQSRYDARTGVDIDAEMSLMVSLQNVYAANARIISAVQAMWDQLLAAVR